MNSEIADASASSESEPSPSDDGLKLDLKFIRDEILRMMVTGIATAKADTLRTFATENWGTLSAVAVTVAGCNLAAAQLACAVVAALAERGVLDPMM